MAQTARTDSYEPTPGGSLLQPGGKQLINGLRQALSIFLSAVGLAWLGRLLIDRDPVQGAWALQLMLALAAFLSGCWGAAHRYRTWTVPMRRLQLLLAKAHSGEISID